MNELDTNLSISTIHEPDNYQEGHEIIESNSEAFIDPEISDPKYYDYVNNKLRLGNFDDLNDYILFQSIGKGSFGSVSKAKLKPCNELKSDEAKEISKLLGDQADVAIKFMKEIKGVTRDKLIKEFNLRNILNEDCNSHLVCYYDAFVIENKNEKIGNKLILIMSLITGEHLFYQDQIKTATYTDDEKKIITKQLLSA